MNLSFIYCWSEWINWWMMKKMGTIAAFVIVENKFEFAFECHVEFISYGQWYSISIFNLKLNVLVHVLRSHVLDICATLLICKENAQKSSSRWCCHQKKRGVCLCIILCHLKCFLKRVRWYMWVINVSNRACTSDVYQCRM